MSIPRSLCWSLCLVLGAGLSLAGCASETTTSETTGSLSLNLEVGNVEIDEVDYLITGEGTAEGGTIDTSAPGSTASVEVFGLLPGDYTVTMSATATDGETTCEGSEDFSVEADELTEIMVYLRCKLPETLGAVRVNGEFNVCAVVKESVVKPLQTSVGNDIDLSAMGEDAEGDDITYIWTGTGGDIDDPNAMDTTYTCEEVGKHSVTITVSDDGFEYCKDSWTTVVTCVAGDGLECIDDEDCGLDEICVDFECVPDLECTDDEDCDLGDICLDNVCRADPDLFCDTGRCVEDAVLRAECVAAFLLCLADNIDEEECIAVSLLICNLPECTEDADCSDENECTDNVCTAGVCSNPNNDNMCNDGAGTCNEGVCEAGPACSDVIDFEDACGPYVFADFDGGVATVVDNPDSSGINTTAKVAEMQKFAGEPWGGSTLALGSAVDWTAGTAFTMKVLATREVPVLFKLEGLLQERSDTYTGSGTWEEVCYDFTGNTGGADATAITFIFDLGVNGDAAGDPDNWTFFFDGIVQTDSCVTECNTGLDCGDDNECTDNVCTAGVCSNPNNDNTCNDGAGTCNAGVCEGGPACSDAIDFEDACGPYVFTDFDGGVATVVDNPDSSGINTTAKVAQMQKFAGEVWGGSWLALDSAVDWTKGTAFTMKVWSSRAVPVLFKLEPLNQERTDNQTGSSSWEELCFDFTGMTGGADATQITFIFDNGTAGDAAGDPDNWTFFFDGIVQTDSCGGGGGGELTTNGDFETGALNIDDDPANGWTLFCDGANVSCEATMDEANGGVWSGHLVAQGGIGDAVIKNANIGIGTVEPNSPISVSVDIKGTTADGGVVFVQFFSELCGGGVSKEEFVGGGAIFPTDTWQTFTLDTTTGPDVCGGVTLQLKSSCGAATTCIGDAFFDNASVSIP